MTRVISGVVLAAVALAAILFLPFPALRVVVCAVAGLAADEYVRITSPARGLCRWVVIAWLSFEVLRQARTLEQAAIDLIAPIYVGAPLGMLVALQSLTGPKGPLLLMATIVVSDTAQYYTGRALGRRPLAPAISPKKTVEGAIGGVLIATTFMAIAMTFLFPATPVVVRVLLGLVIVFLGITGDLFESRLKRFAGMKDSSHLIPGHGGVLDRIDALLFAIPVFYFMVLQGRVG